MWAFVAQTALASAASAALLFAFRWIRSRAPLAAYLFAAGLIARTAIGLGLAVSWFATAGPEARFGPDARWFPDAQMYYVDAADAAAQGLTRVADDDASPVFVRTLALWMRATGESHAGAHLLNLLVFAAIAVAVCAALTRRGDTLGQQAAALVVGAFALSPNLIILASQPLKDTVFFGALACVAIGLWHVCTDAEPSSLRLAAAPMAVVLLGVYVMSGMRAYFGLMILGLLAGVLGLRALWLYLPDRRAPRPFIRRALVLLAVVWLGCRVGGGPYYSLFADPFLAPVTTRVDAAIARGLRLVGVTPPRLGTADTEAAGLLDVVERSRRGFESSGGGTNMAPPELDRSQRVGLLSRVAGVVLGLGAVFVPVSVLRATGIVSFPGGGRFLLLTDVDTLYLDLAIALCLVFVWRRRHELEGRWTLAVFLLALGAVCAVLVGYVVTNYGTLFRLRLLAVVPFWLLPLVLSRATAPASTPAAVVRS